MLREAKALELIGRFYDAVLEPALWSQALGELTGALGAAAGGIHIRTLGPTESAAQIWTGLDPAFENAYLEHYFAHDPWALRVDQAPEGEVHLSRHVLPDHELLRTEFHNDLCRPYGFRDWFGGILLRRPGKYWIAVGMLGHLDGGPFDEEHVSALRRLMPHLQRSLEVGRRLLEAQREAQILGDALDRLAFGVILVDAACRVVRANRAAEQILAQKDGISVDATGLVALELGARAALRAALEQAIRGDLDDKGRSNLVRVPRPSGARPLALVLAPVRREVGPLADPFARCVVYVIAPETTVDLPEDVLRRLFKLTPAEARLALLVGQGRVPKEAAEELGISWNTARFQLRQVFAKTGTDRQASLVRLLASLGVFADQAHDPAGRRRAGHHPPG